MNIISKEEAKELTEWLIEKGLGLGECAYMMCNMECGDTFALALLKVFNERKQKMEALNAKNPLSDWGCPLTP